MLVPPEVARSLNSLRGDTALNDRVFPVTSRRVAYIVKATAKRAGLDEGRVSPHTFRHAHASHAIENGASIALVSQTLGHADLKVTSVCAHARPEDSSSRFLKR